MALSILSLRRLAAVGGLWAAANLASCTFVPQSIRSDKRDTYKYDSPLELQSPAFRRSAAAMGNMMIGGNNAKLLKNGDAIFSQMVRDIDAAKHTVNLEVFIFRGDAAGEQIGHALIDAAKRGVQVRLLIDTFGSKLKKGLKKEMEAAGVKVCKYRPLRLFTLYKVAQRSHRRILVIDGRVAFTGGAAFSKVWMGDARNSKEWRDTMVRVEGPVAAQMQAIFFEDWVYTTGEILTGDAFYPDIQEAGPVTAQAIKASKGDASSMATMLYQVAIESAKKKIYIANPYFLPAKQARRNLIDAVKRGVDVQVMVPGRHGDQVMVRQASWFHYGELLKGGVKIYEYQPTMMHHKTLVVDGIYATIGTINLDAISMNRNAEVSLSFYDRDFARRMEEMFEEDKLRCKEITLKEWKHRGPHKRLSELVFWIWEPYY